MRGFAGLALAVTLVGCCSGCARDEEAPERYLIVHADDAGMCHSVNRATIDAMDHKLVSSASIMVPCPGFHEFAAYARSHPEKDFGVHLVLNSEWSDYRWGPVAPREEVRSLIDSEGFLWKTTSEVARHVKVEEAETELRAQIEQAKEAGIRISHLDSHMSALLTREDLAELYLRLALEHDLPLLVPRLALVGDRELPEALADLRMGAIEELSTRGLPVVDYLEGENYDVPAEKKRSYFLNFVRRLRPGVTIALIHCGYDDRELRRITESAAQRDADRRVFTSLEMAKEIERLGIRITDWGKLRRKMAPAPAEQ